MRYAFLIPLLICSPCSAAFINPLGGSWTDGTTVAPYVEVSGNRADSRYFQSLLTVADNSHVMSNVWWLDQGGRIDVYIDNQLDFIDGSTRIDGQFELELTEPGELRIVLSYDNVFQAYWDDQSVLGFGRPILEPGTYSMNWTIEAGSAVLNHAKRTTIRYQFIPEPGTGWALVLGLGVMLIWWRVG